MDEENNYKCNKIKAQRQMLSKNNTFTFCFFFTASNAMFYQISVTKRCIRDKNGQRKYKGKLSRKK